MKKLVLSLALIAAGLSSANAAEYTLGQGRLVFQGGLTISGCDVDSSIGKPTGPNGGDIYVNMPNQIAKSYIKPLTATTSAAFGALPDQVKRSSALGNGGTPFTLNIVCPIDEMVDNINAALGTTESKTPAILVTSLNTKGKLKFSAATGADAGGIVSNGTLGLLAPSPQSSAKGVGIAFLRTDGPASEANKVVNFNVATDTAQGLIWQNGTDPDLGAVVRTTAGYDFAYVSLTPTGNAGVETGTGDLRHVIGFRFVYEQ